MLFRTTSIVTPNHKRVSAPVCQKIRLKLARSPAGCVWADSELGQNDMFARHTFNARFNARSETATTLPSFRNAWRKGHKCIIAADAIDEPDWHTGKAQAPRMLVILPEASYTDWLTAPAIKTWRFCSNTQRIEWWLKAER